MKNIVLARKLYRILAGLIDLLIIAIISVILFLTWIYPVSFDRKGYEANTRAMVNALNESGLYICSEDGSYCGKTRFDAARTYDGIFHCDLTWSNEVYKDNCLTKDLYLYYTTLFTKFGATENMTTEAYESSVLKINTTESNIKSFDTSTYTFELMDESRNNITLEFFLTAYETAAKAVEKSTAVTNYTSKNRTIMLKSIVLVIPVIAAVSFVFAFLIPLFSPHNETIGKYIFKLGVLSKDGYKLNKLFLIPRWLCYTVIEVLLGIATFAGTFLISYTMFMFTKKRRCMHDFFGNSVVYDKTTTIYFDSPKEEEFYKRKIEAKKHE